MSKRSIAAPTVWILVSVSINALIAERQPAQVNGFDKQHRRVLRPQKFSTMHTRRMPDFAPRPPSPDLCIVREVTVTLPNMARKTAFGHSRIRSKPQLPPIDSELPVAVRNAEAEAEAAARRALPLSRGFRRSRSHPNTQRTQVGLAAQVAVRSPSARGFS